MYEIHTEHLPTQGMSMTERIMALALTTEDAYSRDFFTDSGWRQTIREFLTRGFNDEQIITLLMSKHIRWAIDSAPRQKNLYTSVDILDYFDKGTNYVEKFTPDDYDHVMSIVIKAAYRWTR